MRPLQTNLMPLTGDISLDGIRVLAVDDDPDTRELLSTILMKAGADVRMAASAAEAVEILQDWLPDVLISDIEMPGEDGYQLIHQIRALEPERGGRIPAAALIAYTRVEDRMRVLSAGFQLHVPKPIEPAELATVIASLAGRLGKPASVSPK
jgi:CheY-like chemotaxis protein